MIQCTYVKNMDQLKEIINTGIPSIYLGAKTSTVLPFDREDAINRTGIKNLVVLSQMPSKMEVLKEETDFSLVRVQGGVSWKDLREFCQSKGLLSLTSPTEENALVLSGLATSATGERCFGHGTLRDQVESLKFLDYSGKEQTLTKSKPIDKWFNKTELDLLRCYQNEFNHSYKNFKNGPFPRLESEIDLMVGTEGQLGVITEAVIKVLPNREKKFIFLKLPCWEDSLEIHLRLAKWAQEKRNMISACELLDSNSLSVLPESERPFKSTGDLIFLEVNSDEVELVFDDLTESLSEINPEDIFLMDASKCHQLRMSVPRYTFERNSLMGVLKKGTDVQVALSSFDKLFKIYKEFTDHNVPYNLFGHFGDCHLHFNFFPKPEQQELCDDLLKKMYKKVAEMKGSPFAEHGIGLFKKKFMKDFYGENQYKMFEILKEKLDPRNQFFPSGYMSMKF